TRTSRLRTITYGTSFLHFSFTATPTTAIYTLSLHDALPIYALLHPAGYYTLNNIPDGPRLKISSANVLKKASPAEEVVQEHARVVEEKPAPGPTRAVPSTSKRITIQPADWTGGPEQVIELHPLPGLKFNTDQVTVPVGARVKLTFNNTDDMPHNVVITKPGTADETGVKALQLGLNGQRMNFVPDSEN